MEEIDKNITVRLPYERRPPVSGVHGSMRKERRNWVQDIRYPRLSRAS
jgi:hypothetical protein